MLLEEFSNLHSYCLVGFVEHCQWYISTMEIYPSQNRNSSSLNQIYTDIP